MKKEFTVIKETKNKEEKSNGRRKFISKAGLGIAGLTAVGLSGCYSEKPSSKTKVRCSMVIDMRRCTGCRACAVACKAENGIRLGAFRSWVSDKEEGKHPNVKRHFLPRLCNHCESPPCLKVCPPGATYKRDDGIVAVDKTRCIGCKHCMVACPYNVRYFNPKKDPEGEKRFPARTHGIVDKCTFCFHRLDNGVVPSCVNTCPAKARIFGDLNDPDSEVSHLIAKESATTLLPEFGTGPSVFYINAHSFSSDDILTTKKQEVQNG